MCVSLLGGGVLECGRGGGDEGVRREQMEPVSS